MPAVPGGARRVVGAWLAAQGLDAAVRDAGAVVHLAASPFRPGRVDAGGTRALAEAITRSGRGPHLVYVSIVGGPDPVAVLQAEEAG